ncbi:MAG: glucose-1-phosphate thymidylyltransferase RfbA [Planctomycetota bacterium]|jgi:glucose-1-phosphate thymidylyltransferase|nr:glucose-1-phosphate thymidylyltransferase RfbA [Planctomycetota bacterium]
MKGIVLAGGSGTRLYPVTRGISKQLLPVYDKPMVYYPLSVLMLAGIREILLVSTPLDLPLFKRLLGDGSDFGLSLSYAEQARPEGLPQALSIGREFLAGSPVCLILGDNIFYGQDLTALLRKNRDLAGGATLFAYHVTTPERYGVVELNPAGEVLSLEEKPDKPRSHLAVTGLYFFGPDAPDEADRLKPGRRGELEILDLARRYWERGELRLERFGRGTAWFDTGTHLGLLDAANFIHAVQSRQGLQIGCLEEIAYRQGWIDQPRLEYLAGKMENSTYGKYLLSLTES